MAKRKPNVGYRPGVNAVGQRYMAHALPYHSTGLIRDEAEREVDDVLALVFSKDWFARPGLLTNLVLQAKKLPRDEREHRLRVLAAAARRGNLWVEFCDVEKRIASMEGRPL